MDILTKIKIDGIEYELGGSSQPATIDQPGIVTIKTGEALTLETGVIGLDSSWFSNTWLKDQINSNSGLIVESGFLRIDTAWLEEYINTYLGTSLTSTTTITEDSGN